MAHWSTSSLAVAPPVTHWRGEIFKKGGIIQASVYLKLEGSKVSGSAYFHSENDSSPIENASISNSQLEYSFRDNENRKVLCRHPIEPTLNAQTLEGVMITDMQISPLKIRRITLDNTPPESIYHPDPDYTAQALQSRREGTVVIDSWIDIDGKPQSLTIKQSLGMGLDQKALDCANKWRFIPAYRSGQPMRTRAILEIHFRLKDPPPSSNN